MAEIYDRKGKREKKIIAKQKRTKWINVMAHEQPVPSANDDNDQNCKLLFLPVHTAHGYT